MSNNAGAGSGAAQFTAWYQGELARANALVAEIIALPGVRTLENTLRPYNQLAIHLDNASARGNLYSEVQPDQAFREAGEACVREVAALATDLSLNRALHDAIAAVDVAGLDAGARRLHERTLRDFRRAGVDQDEATRARLRALSDLEVELGQQFDKNIREDVRAIGVTPAQLDGLPEDYRAAHPPGADGLVRITTDYPDFVPFRQYCRDAGARMALYREFMNRGWPKNDAVFQQLLAVRAEKAKLLGYKDWADYVTEDKMIRSGAAVREFIEKIAALSERSARRDYATLLARFKQDVPDATAVHGSDATYYEEAVKRERFAFDSQEARRYFDFERTRAGLLQTTGRIFGLRYEPVPTSGEGANANRWHEDVDVHDVYRLEDGKRLGRIYLDLHAREGKYKHAAQFTIVSGIAGQQLPEGALVCNFSRGLMDHDEVVTMFHEFGHLMHHILGGHQTWAKFSGVATEWDFVEAPSQMLEEWAWDPGVLATFAKDEQGNAIPAALVERMRAADEFGEAYRVRTQMFYASLSLRFHQLDPGPGPAGGIDTTAIVQEEQRTYSVFEYVPETHFQASFGHLNGYSAMYYTYMWSLVIAKDLFSAFQERGLMDETTARRYRDKVLVPGGARDAADLVQDFLGRPYGFEAFRRWLEKGG